MAKSFLQELRISLEDETLVEGVEVTPEEEAEADAAYQEAEAVRQEIEAEVEASERAEAVVEELEGTNEAVQAIIEEKGELSESEAALVEAQRRTAAAALNLDPEEGAGAELVDQAGLESMVTNKGTIALEENQGMIAKIKAFIESVKKKVKALWEKLKVVVGKFFKVVPKQIKELAAYFKVTKPEEFKGITLDGLEGLEPFDIEAFTSVKNITNFLNSIGKSLIGLLTHLDNKEEYIKFISSVEKTAKSPYNEFKINAESGKLQYIINPLKIKDTTWDYNTAKKVIEVAMNNLKTVELFDSALMGYTSNFYSVVDKLVNGTSTAEEMSNVRLRVSNMTAFFSISNKFESDFMKAIRQAIKVGNYMRNQVAKKAKSEEA